MKPQAPVPPLKPMPPRSALSESPAPRVVTLPLKRLLLVLGGVATAYAAALLVWGDNPRASLAHLWSWTGVQAGLLCLLNYGLRGIRWRLWMAHYGRHFGPLEGLRLYLAGYAFTPTPGNVGEAVRGLMLARNPLGARQSLAIFGAERMADLLCLLLLCLPALWWVLHQSSMARAVLVWLPMVLAAGLLLAAAVLGVLFRRRRALMQRFGWLHEAWDCLALRPLVWLALTLLAWAAQGLAVWLICRAFGVSPSAFEAMGFYALAMVAGALSALPAGLGGTEVVLTGLLVGYGASPGAALGITVLTRLLTLWLAVGIGLLALLYSAAIRKEISFR